MFIAAGSDFSGGNVDGVKNEGQKRKPPPNWAAADVASVRFRDSIRNACVPNLDVTVLFEQRLRCFY